MAVTGALIWPVTDLIAAHDVGQVAASVRADHLQAAREAVRAQLLTLGAGVFAAGALVFTWRNFGLSRQGQVTDRYTRAVEQLGSDKIDVRIGGIYALERVGRDSAADHPTVMEVLAAFIREHSREQWPPSDHGIRGVPPEARMVRPDVLAAMGVIGRRRGARDRGRVDLTASVLPRAVLFGANLARVRLVDADLTDAVLFDADLSQSNMAGAILIRANLAGAKLSETSLAGADLSSADLTDADLTGADLTGAKLPSPQPVPDGWTRISSTELLQRNNQAH